MAFNIVQQKFVGETARVHLERVVRILNDLDTYVANFDAIQSGPDALPEDGTVLDDAGAAPRADAPQLEGVILKQLRDFSVSMSAVVNPTVKEILIQKMVRPLSSVLRSD